jgi:hypothetical protein
LSVLDPNLLEVKMESHKLGKGLLTYQPLSLEVHLGNSLGRQTVTSLDVLPLSDPKLHPRDLQNFDFLSCPSRW